MFLFVDLRLGLGDNRVLPTTPFHVVVDGAVPSMVFLRRDPEENVYLYSFKIIFITLVDDVGHYVRVTVDVCLF